jgi:hypothetical protein
MIATSRAVEGGTPRKFRDETESHPCFSGFSCFSRRETRSELRDAFVACLQFEVCCGS